MGYIDGYPEEVLINTHFIWKNTSSFKVFLFQKMLPFGWSFLVSISALFFFLFDFFSKLFSRIQINKLSQSNNQIHIEPQEETEETKTDANEFKETESDVVEEKESPKFFFKFQFQTQTFEEFSRKFRGDENYNVGLESIPSTSTNKYEFKSGQDFSCIFEKPEDLTFCVRKFYANSENGFLSEKDFMERNLKDEAVPEEVTEKEEKVPEKTLLEAEQSAETVCEEEAVGEENNLPIQQEVSGNFQFFSEKDFTISETETDSITSSPEYMSQFIGSTSDGFLSDRDFEEDFEADCLRNIGKDVGELTKEDFDMQEADDFDKEDRDIMEELRNLEESQKWNEDSKQEEVSGNNNGSGNTLDNSQNSYLDNSYASDSDDSNGLETLWEHQDLIEQLKMELKKVRAIGLPTILEESESPKIMDDLKPWKIDEKFHHVDRMSELHKFYKSYRERMRKFDILNYQKMYAIGFLQSKDPLQSISNHKSSSPPAITSLLSQNLRLGRQKKSKLDPMKKFIEELHSDLEIVYVGQLCLSWEILHWQYEKAIEIWESDPYGIRQYNEVAGEFQQFQVLMQRFIENEPFEGPRVQNYVKNRCVLRNLLQVPVIREDSMKDKRKARRKGRDDDAITSDMLVEIMEESIRIFWRFVRADKVANIVIPQSRKGTQVEPLDPADLELLVEVQTSLQTKDRKLKDILRNGNCILRKFRKNREESPDQVLYFFSQVDLKLVARVLNTSKVTKDQLLWCHSKLSKISFVNRKINVEPSFLLFPC
ncbi:60S ribosomal protein L34, putative [Theobroma cacao]|uniref:60S ribosomal protein L34, putative n=1 Tax=Theobroma cacao TaxID=3641 RepID=A0A061EMA0_THECC|nr:60S ribosomal protein L34, putative [Theobroma cacao]